MGYKSVNDQLNSADSLIITVKEARKLLGKKASAKFTDAQVEGIINQLDFVATRAIRHHKSQQFGILEGDHTG